MPFLTPLGQDLRAVVSDFWAQFPESNVHFFIETDRFCKYLKAQLAAGRSFNPELPAILERESAAVASALEESYTEGKN